METFTFARAWVILTKCLTDNNCFFSRIGSQDEYACSVEGFVIVYWATNLAASVHILQGCEGLELVPVRGVDLSEVMISKSGRCYCYHCAEQTH